MPTEGYLKKAYDLCKKNNVLFIADEVQTGLSRTGKLLCHWHEGFKADIVVLGKALSGGMMPISAVLANDEIMLTILPGEHGSTFGGNPLASKIAVEALKILVEGKLDENADKMGRLFREKLGEVKHPMIEKIRGKGLLNAMVIKPSNGKSAWDVCVAMRNNGLLAKPTHDHIIRFAPPLIINEQQILEGVEIIRKTLASM